MSFTGLVVVCLVAVLAPLVASVIPRVRIPGIVLEILAGVAIGPSGFGWVRMDDPIRVLSIIGLSFLLFLVGLELDIALLRGPRLRTTGVAFLVSSVLAYAVSYGLHLLGVVESALLVAICLSATAIGIIVPILTDAGEGATEFGQLVIAAASIANFGTVLLLSVLFSRQPGPVATKLVLIGGFAALTIVLIVAISAAERWKSLGNHLLKLQDSTAQIRIRAAFLLLVGLVALAVRQGLEAILGAFVAGAMLSMVDHDYTKTHPKFHEKLHAIGFGIFVPVFFVASGIQFDAGSLLSDPSVRMRVPIFLAALLVVRGLPALLYTPLIGLRRSIVAGLLQATSLPFIVASVTIGVELHELTRPNASALIAAGLLSVVIFPIVANVLLHEN